MIIMGSFILFQSAYINRRRKYHPVRLCADVSAIFTVFSGFAYLVAMYNPNTVKTAIVYGLFYNGIFNVMIQLSDNYLFIISLNVVERIPRWKLYLLLTFIYLVMCSPWLCTYTIAPFFCDVNSPAYHAMSRPIVENGVGWGTFLYNVYCTAYFVRFLYKTNIVVSTGASNNETSSGDTRLPPANLDTVIQKRIISMKCIGHFVTSSIGNLLYAYYPIWGVPIYCICITMGIHFWFNLKSERYVCPRQMSRVKRAVVHAEFSRGDGQASASGLFPFLGTGMHGFIVSGILRSSSAPTPNPSSIMKKGTSSKHRHSNKVHPSVATKAGGTAPMITSLLLLQQNNNNNDSANNHNDHNHVQNFLNSDRDGGEEIEESVDFSQLFIAPASGASSAQRSISAGGGGSSSPFSRSPLVRIFAQPSSDRSRERGGGGGSGGHKFPYKGVRIFLQRDPFFNPPDTSSNQSALLLSTSVATAAAAVGGALVGSGVAGGGGVGAGVDEAKQAQPDDQDSPRSPQHEDAAESLMADKKDLSRIIEQGSSSENSSTTDRRQPLLLEPAESESEENEQDDE
jgi:hypothetical protein